MIFVTYLTIVSEIAALIYSLFTGLNIAWAGIIHRLDLKSLTKRAGASLLVFIGLCVIPAFVYLKFPEAAHIMDYWKWNFSYNEYEPDNYIGPLHFHLGPFSRATGLWDWCLQEGIRWGLNICLVSSIVLLLYVSLGVNQTICKAWDLKTLSIPHFDRIRKAAGIGHVIGLAVMLLGSFFWLLWIVGILVFIVRPIKTIKSLVKLPIKIIGGLFKVFTR